MRIRRAVAPSAVKFQDGDYRIHSTRVITPTGVIEATLIIADGKIQDVSPVAWNVEGISFESVGNKVIMPGVIDAHVHINEPGRTEWEGFETATKAAAAGGTTTLIEMPLNASPVTTTVAALKLKLEAAKGKLHVNVRFLRRRDPHQHRRPR
jgi:allantoinase